MTQIIQDRWQVRRYLTAAIAASVNDVLLQGELGLELDTNRFKFGDGITQYNALPYVQTGELDISDIWMF
jgi:hypothetical protein